MKKRTFNQNSVGFLRRRVHARTMECRCLAHAITMECQCWTRIHKLYTSLHALYF